MMRYKDSDSSNQLVKIRRYDCYHAINHTSLGHLIVLGSNLLIIISGKSCNMSKANRRNPYKYIYHIYVWEPELFLCHIWSRFLLCRFVQSLKRCHAVIFDKCSDIWLSVIDMVNRTCKNISLSSKTNTQNKISIFFKDIRSRD